MKTFPTPDDLQFLKGWDMGPSESGMEGFMRLRLHRFSGPPGEPTSMRSPGIAMEIAKLRAFHAELSTLLELVEASHSSKAAGTDLH